MNLNKLSSVIYFTPKGDEVYTFIKEINDQDGSYILDFEDESVSENVIKLNTHSIFSVPSSMTNEDIVNYHYHQLMNNILGFLKKNNPCTDINVSREGEVICFETMIESPKALEEKKYFHEEIDKLNALIGQTNSQIKSRFNKHVEVVLKLPLSTHHLHAIRV